MTPIKMTWITVTHIIFAKEAMILRIKGFFRWLINFGHQCRVELFVKHCPRLIFVYLSQSSSSETSSLLKHSGHGRLMNRGQISMQFVADSPDSPLSSMTSSNSFFTSVSRQRGRPVMPSVNGGLRFVSIYVHKSQGCGTLLHFRIE